MALMALCIVPCERDEANAFVRQHHRHHGPVPGHKFAVACAEGETIHGVAIVGRPSSRVLDDGMTLEVVRVATDGARNAASALYGACRRATFALGYRKLITYTLATEPGTSLRAAGWREIARVNGGSWNTPSRPRVDKHPTQQKIRWEAQP